MASSLGVNLTLQYAQFTEGINKAAGSLKALEGIAKTAGAAIASQLSYSAIKALGEMGAKALQTETAFANVTRNMGIDAQKFVATLKEATKGTVDESDLMIKAMKGLTGGLSMEQVTKIAQISSTVAIRWGMDVADAYAMMEDAIEKGTTRGLIKLGLLTKAESEVLEEAKKAGVEIDIFRVIMEKASNQQALIEALDQTALSFQRAKAASKDFWEDVGKEAAKVIGGIYEIGYTIKNLFTAEGRAANIKKAGEVLSTKAMNEVYFPSPGNVSTASPYLDSLRGAKDRKAAADAAAKQAEAIKKVIDNLSFEYAQLQRTGEQQAIYNALNRVGVELNSKDGKVIAEKATQLYRMKSALEAEDEQLKALEASIKRERDEFVKAYEEKERVISTFNDDFNKATQTELEYELGKLDAEYKYYAQFIDNVSQLDALYYAKKAKLLDDDFEKQQAADERYKLKMERLWEEQHPYAMMALETWTMATREMEAAFSDTLFSAITGDLKSFNDIFVHWCNAILKTFTDMVAKMVVEWATAQAGMSTATAANSSGGGLWGSLASIGGWVASFFHEGGIVGQTAAPQVSVHPSVFAHAPRLHNGLQGDEYPAILQRGERVIPKGKAGGVTVIINGNVLNNHDELARMLIPAIRKAEYDGV